MFPVSATALSPSASSDSGACHSGDTSIVGNTMSGNLSSWPMEVRNACVVASISAPYLSALALPMPAIFSNCGRVWGTWATITSMASSDR
eukprot:CAMPEP_0173257744 /NCGR_PEP_ID=MMETSP1142-20121109/23954_1 /TAXON_ID=483371 /ORGANISM="non described non described, Strain CCMP2298" /LENGTH=89 /DNA_ID=CAMNT_0014191935 /DNA_START=149 /DNA_END=418 /DNA_ORIENTATION=+